MYIPLIISNSIRFWNLLWISALMETISPGSRVLACKWKHIYTWYNYNGSDISHNSIIAIYEWKKLLHFLLLAYCCIFNI